ncbi:hypothetical protein FQA47_008768 [Oryzias melastigma]|uniref:Uncharacterized protein n=1 Tax=Oryzias melastigma TaxID=30732 RepID=A0A834FD66_ORYME|nr:hypothetical protein FQA47_008768 [Oryzias melastigma]
MSGSDSVLGSRAFHLECWQQPQTETVCRRAAARSGYLVLTDGQQTHQVSFTSSTTQTERSLEFKAWQGSGLPRQPLWDKSAFIRLWGYWWQRRSGFHTCVC